MRIFYSSQLYVSLRLRKSLNEPVVIFSVSGIILRNKSTNSEIFEYRLDSFLLSIFLKSTFLSFLISIVNFLKIKIFESPFFYCQYSRKCLIWVAGFFEIQLSGSTHFCCLFLKRKFYEKILHCCHKNLVSGLIFGHFLKQKFKHSLVFIVIFLKKVFRRRNELFEIILFILINIIS